MPNPIIPSSFFINYFDKVESTNQLAILEANQGKPSGTVIVANAQSSGRGRLGRQWLSPPGNLYTSIIIRPNCPPMIAAQISLVTSVAIWETVSYLLPANKKILCKWPNDILINYKKVSGILLESQTAIDSKNNPIVEWIIVGVGINISSYPKLKENYQATSISEECRIHINKDQVLNLFLSNFKTMLSLWTEQGFNKIINLWLNKTFPLGHSISVQSPKGMICGKFNGLTPQGELKIHTRAHGEKIIAAGDTYYPDTGEVNASCN